MINLHYSLRLILASERWIYHLPG